MDTDSLQMYDHTNTNGKAIKLKCSPNVHFEDDLNTPEVSFDFQGFLASPPSPPEEGDLFTPPSLDASSSASSLDHSVIVKQEPSSDYTLYKQPRYASASRKSSKKYMDKNSDEYKRRRERNNLAVRKSREKAKQRTKETENRVASLKMENDSLKKQAEILDKELTILKSLLKNVGVPNEIIEAEISQVMQHRHLNTYTTS